MKKALYTLALISGTLFAVGQTATTTTTPNVTASGQALNPEYPAFRKNAEQQIADNDKRIADLRLKTNRQDNTALNDVRNQKINDLEKKNADLRKRLFGYEKSNTDWVVFKRDFMRDMDDLHNAFRDFGDDRKN